jgi:hypothetical protein
VEMLVEVFLGSSLSSGFKIEDKEDKINQNKKLESGENARYSGGVRDFNLMFLTLKELSLYSIVTFRLLFSAIIMFLWIFLIFRLFFLRKFASSLLVLSGILFMWGASAI